MCSSSPTATRRRTPREPRRSRWDPERRSRACVWRIARRGAAVDRASSIAAQIAAAHLRRTVRRGEGRASSVLVHRRARDDRDAVAASNENRATRLRSNVPVGVRVEGLTPPRGREHPRAAEGGVHDGRERETRAGGELLRARRRAASPSSRRRARRHTRGDQGRGTRGVHGGRGARGAQEERETTARRARFVSRACERARGDSDGSAGIRVDAATPT